MTDIQLPSHPAEALILSKVSAEIRNRAARIQLMVFDVDGVLTDGTLWYSRSKEVIKGFHARDGHGLKLLREGGITVALMTGRDSPVVAKRAIDLGISHVLQGISDKGTALQQLMQQLQVEPDTVGFMGDDLLDITAMRKVGFAVSVPDAPVYITQAAHWVTTISGGKGAARECADLLLAAQGKLGKFIQQGSTQFLTSGLSQ